MTFVTETGKDIEKAARLLTEASLVAIPTETVYGLAGNALNEAAVAQIFEVKKRPANNPLIVHVHGTDQLNGIVRHTPDLALKLFDAFSPGPLTIILPKSTAVSSLVSAGQNTVAVRIPDNQITLDLLRLVQFPLAAPSANTFMSISPTRPAHVLAQLGGKIPYILDGGSCNRGIESTIVGVEENRIVVYRSGAVSGTELSRLGVEVVSVSNSAGVRAPGMFKKHYAPNTKLLLTKSIAETATMYEGNAIGLLTFGDGVVTGNFEVVRNLSTSGDVNEAAYNLYDALFELDNLSLDFIICPFLPDCGIGVGINDRLQKAATIIIN